MATSKILNDMIDNIRQCDTDLADGGAVLDMITPVVQENMEVMAGGTDDVRLDAGITVCAMLVERVKGLSAQQEIDDDLAHFAIDLVAEMSIALCRLHS